MFKNILRTAAQKLIGFKRYLYVFSLMNIFRIKYLGGEPEFLFFLNTIQKQGAMLDIGANIGFTTVLMANKFPLSTIYAFEPVPDSMYALKKVVKHYQLQNIVTLQTAVGNSEGEVTMQIPLVKKAIMQGLSHVIEKSIYHSEGECIKVPMQKLDSMEFLQNLPAISAIKIDVENFEYFVLEGGKTLIGHHKPIIFCELWNDERRMLCFALMQKLGYQIKICRKNKLVDFKDQAALNFFFVPNE